VEHNGKPTARKEWPLMDPISQLAGDHHRQRLAHAAQQRPARRLLAIHRATRRAERAERRLRRAIRQARQLHAQLQAQITNTQ